jgi:hypothetical protein
MATTVKWQSKRFSFLSDAKSFQREKQKKGYKTKLEKHAGIANPYSVVKWTKKD